MLWGVLFLLYNSKYYKSYLLCRKNVTLNTLSSLAVERRWNKLVPVITYSYKQPLPHESLLKLMRRGKKHSLSFRQQTGKHPFVCPGDFSVNRTLWLLWSVNGQDSCKQTVNPCLCKNCFYSNNNEYINVDLLSIYCISRAVMYSKTPTNQIWEIDHAVEERILIFTSAQNWANIVVYTWSQNI